MEPGLRLEHRTLMMVFISGGVTCLALSMAARTCCWCWRQREREWLVGEEGSGEDNKRNQERRGGAFGVREVERLDSNQ